VQTPIAAQPPPAGVHVPVGCAVGQVGQVVHVQTGVAPLPQTQTTLPKVQVPSPVMQEVWLSGGVVGQLAGFPPLLLPLLVLLLVVEPLLLPLLVLLLVVEPLLLPLLVLLPAEPLLLPLLLPPGESVLASPPFTPVLVLPPHPGATTAAPPAVIETRKRTSSARMERDPP
jgi:hypothetical protein